MSRLSLRSLLLLCLIAIGSSSAVRAQAQPEAAKLALIREVLALTQVAEQSLSVMKKMTEAQRVANPNIPSAFWDRFLTRAQERSGELVELLVPVYHEIFTTEDLRALITFYRSPAGVRFLAAQPALIQASMEAGERWGLKLGQDVAQELENEGTRIQ